MGFAASCLNRSLPISRASSSGLCCMSACGSAGRRVGTVAHGTGHEYGRVRHVRGSRSTHAPAAPSHWRAGLAAAARAGCASKAFPSPATRTRCVAAGKQEFRKAETLAARGAWQAGRSTQGQAEGGVEAETCMLTRHSTQPALTARRCCCCRAATPACQHTPAQRVGVGVNRLHASVRAHTHMAAAP